MRQISVSDLVALVKGDAEHAILDLRREGDFAKGHLFFATNIPRSLLELRIEGLVPRKTTPVVLVEAGFSIEDAETVFAQFGYSDVCLLNGGSRAWEEAGFRLYDGINVPSKAFGEFIENTAGTPHVSPEELHNFLEKDPRLVLIDARPYDEYQAMSIRGAVNCPGAELVYRVGSLNLKPDQKIVVNCAGRTRSIIGAQTLIDSGLKNPVFALRDGTMGWHLAGFSLENMQQNCMAPSSSMQLELIREGIRERADRVGVRFVGSLEVDSFMSDPERTTYVFDIRDPNDYRKGHRAGAVSAPGGQLVQTFDTFVVVRNARVILCDQEGIRALMVASWLRQMGIVDVFCLTDCDTSSRDLPPSQLADALVAQARLIEVGDLEAYSSRGYALFDLSSSKVFRRGHIVGALFAERAALARDLAAGSKIILISPDGRLAQIVAHELISKGFNAYAMKGGMHAWREAGLPVEQGNGNLPSNPNDVFYRPYDLTNAAEDSMRAYLDWEKGLMDHVVSEPGAAFRRF